MAARLPRRSFAAPFVVTLAAGCYTQAPPPAQPPPAQPDPVVANPPRPAPQPDPQPAQSPPANPPAPQPDPTPTHFPPTNPPAPQPATSEATWTVTKSGAICTAAIQVDCKPPRLACNPPGPHPTDCYPNMADGASLTVVRHAGATDCIIPPAPVHCPPKVACNPPPPRHVTCPK